jgi:hypothetical protein
MRGEPRLPKSASNRIALKVINYCGDNVMKVCLVQKPMTCSPSEPLGRVAAIDCRRDAGSAY